VSVGDDGARRRTRSVTVLAICFVFVRSFATGFSTMSEIIKSATYHFNTKNDLIQVRTRFKGD